MESQNRAEITFMASRAIVIVSRAKSDGMNRWRTDMFEWSIVEVDAGYLQKLQDDLAEYQRIGSVDEFRQLKQKQHEDEVEYVDRKKLKDVFYRYKKYGSDDEEERIHNAAICQCIVALNAAPDENVTRGYWIDRPLIKLGKLSNVPVVECSRCGITFCDVINNHHTMYKFCPHCGAKMEEWDESD